MSVNSYGLPNTGVWFPNSLLTPEPLNQPELDHFYENWLPPEHLGRTACPSPKVHDSSMRTWFTTCGSFNAQRLLPRYRRQRLNAPQGLPEIKATMENTQNTIHYWQEIVEIIETTLCPRQNLKCWHWPRPYLRTDRLPQISADST